MYGYAVYRLAFDFADDSPPGQIMKELVFYMMFNIFTYMWFIYPYSFFTRTILLEVKGSDLRGSNAFHTLLTVYS